MKKLPKLRARVRFDLDYSALQDPIKPPRALYSTDPEALHEAMFRVTVKRLEKLELLSRKYGVADYADRWQLLALQLACEHVRGFKLVRRSGGAPRKWGGGTDFDLVEAIDAIVAERGVKIADAVRQLRNRLAKAPDPHGWRKLKGLATRYYEAKQRINKMERDVVGRNG